MATIAKKLKRTFVWLSRAWYGAANLPPHSAVIDEFQLQIANHSGEIQIQWKTVGNSAVHIVSFFEESWRIVPHFADFFAAMAERTGQPTSQEEMAKILKSLGICDATERVRPKPDGLALVVTPRLSGLAVLRLKSHAAPAGRRNARPCL